MKTEKEDRKLKNEWKYKNEEWKKIENEDGKIKNEWW